MPLIHNFNLENSGKVDLVNSEDISETTSINEPLNRTLPGWMITYTPSPERENAFIKKGDYLPFGLAGLAFIAIFLSCLAIWKEMRRQYADVEIRNRFIANVSHELKTPLSLIRMYSETLSLGRVHEPEKQQNYYRVILRESERLSSLIENILDFSRLRDGASIYHLTETNLAKTVTTVLDRYMTQFERRGLKVTTRFQAELPPVAHDPDGITQIILNLFDNAAKYAITENGIEIALLSDNDWVELQVIDYGPGLPENEHLQLMLALQNGRVANVVHGSGIGLAMVEMITKAHNGHLIIDTPDTHSGLKAIVSFPAYKE